MDKTEKMTSRQRLLDSMRHKEPDQVPVDLGSTTSSGISAIAYHNLKSYLGIDVGHTRVFDVVQQLAQIEPVVLDRFGIDTVNVGDAFNRDSQEWYDHVLPDGTPVQFPDWFKPVVRPNGAWDIVTTDGVQIATMPQGATFFDQTYYPYANGYPAQYDNYSDAVAKVSWMALPTSPWDKAGTAEFWERLRSGVLALRQSTERALVLTAGFKLFEPATFLRRMDNLMMDLVLNPTEVERLADIMMEHHMPVLEKLCEAVGDVVDIIRLGDDLGMDRGPLFSPEIYRQIYKPRHGMLIDYIKDHSQMLTCFHTCGSIYNFIPDFIDIGLDALNPVQTSARNMEPRRLKREFGRDIAFWGGGADTRTVMNLATPQEVKDHVKRNLEILSPGGGYVFNPVHNLMPDVPPENIIAMFEAVDEFNGG